MWQTDHKIHIFHGTAKETTTGSRNHTIGNQLDSLWTRLYDRAVGYSKDSTWWLSVFYVLCLTLNFSHPRPLSPGSSENGTILNAMPHWTLCSWIFVFSPALRYLPHLAGRGNPNWTHLVVWATINWFVRVMQQPCYIRACLKSGKIFRNPEEKVTKAETVKSIKIY